MENNRGPNLVIVVSGSKRDSDYWNEHYKNMRHDIFRTDGETHVISVSEATKKGNFLGMLNAWDQTKHAIDKQNLTLPDVGLMSMVVGSGTRLSPFTQTMGNRKPALLTPAKASNGHDYFNAADISNLYTNSWIQHFRECGFRGLVMKWGDEALIPGTIWNTTSIDYSRADAIRLVWLTEITDTLAREKEWIEIDESSGLMTFQYSRQDAMLLRERFSRLANSGKTAGVNLGSFAISYRFLDIALEIFKEDVLDSNKWITWDPYVWIALSCQDKRTWEEELEIESQTGLTGIKDLQKMIPDFFDKVSKLRERLESENQYDFSVPTIDFGNLLFVDLGLHGSLRSNLNAMLTDSSAGEAIRKIFKLPTERDKNGNTVIGSRIPEEANIRNSLIIDSVITDTNTEINQGIVVGGQHKRVTMIKGGIALFCAVDYLEIQGADSIAYRSIGKDIVVPPGGRHTTLLMPDGSEHMVTNETITDYKEENYTTPILGNTFSFSEAANIMANVEPQDLEKHFQDQFKKVRQENRDV